MVHFGIKSIAEVVAERRNVVQEKLTGRGASTRRLFVQNIGEMTFFFVGGATQVGAAAASCLWCACVCCAYLLCTDLYTSVFMDERFEFTTSTSVPFDGAKCQPIAYPN